ncbi:hypothetical protein BDZ94DRAFT_1140622, partial [Collybia nuda]
LDDDKDSQQVEDIDYSAGQVIRMSDNLHEQWRQIFQLNGPDSEGDISMEPNPEGDDLYSPFSSELDWRVAKWAVEEGVGHNSFNHLLDIPGV